MSDTLPNAMIWLTGITPIALEVLSGFKPVILTFDEAVADPVGLLDTDVDNMLNEVHRLKPFSSTDEKTKVRDAIKMHYNGLRFLLGAQLYHTRMVNQLMEKLLGEQSRAMWLGNLSKPCPHMVADTPPSTVFGLVKRARNLRSVVGRLVAVGEVSGYSLNAALGLSGLMAPNVDIGDYLTLLVHLGLSSVSPDQVFKVTCSDFRKSHLEPLIDSSLGELLRCGNAEQAYREGVMLLQEFLSSVSRTSMQYLVAWARASAENHIMDHGVTAPRFHGRRDVQIALQRRTSRSSTGNDAAYGEAY
jgi:hypothetical protein